jgi:hypothetical protein
VDNIMYGHMTWFHYITQHYMVSILWCVEEGWLLAVQCSAVQWPPFYLFVLVLVLVQMTSRYVSSKWNEGERQPQTANWKVRCGRISTVGEHANIWYDMTWHDMTWHDMTWQSRGKISRCEEIKPVNFHRTLTEKINKSKQTEL